MKESNKDIAVSFLEMASSGEVDKAYSKFIGDNFKHHNAYYEGSADSLRNGMKENAIQNPNKVWILNCIFLHPVPKRVCRPFIIRVVMLEVVPNKLRISLIHLPA